MTQLLYGDVTRDDSQRRFLAQHIVTTLFRMVTTLFQHSDQPLNNYRDKVTEVELIWSNPGFISGPFTLLIALYAKFIFQIS